MDYILEVRMIDFVCPWTNRSLIGSDRVPTVQHSEAAIAIASDKHIYALFILHHGFHTILASDDILIMTPRPSPFLAALARRVTNAPETVNGDHEFTRTVCWNNTGSIPTSPSAFWTSSRDDSCVQ